MRKWQRRILLAMIFISLGGVAYKVGESVWNNKVEEIKKNPLKALDYLPESALHMKDFRRAKIEDGRKVWEIVGDEANYYKEQKQAVIKKPRFYYYDKKGETAETTGEVAKLFFKEKELEQMQLQGNVEVNYQGYTLRSEEAIYLPDKQQIVVPTKATVVGEGLQMEGSSMQVELDEKKVRLLQNVKTKLEPDKLAKKKKMTATNQVTGG
ncbi:MAG TPA: LPS export ABC transporter periplasmic protein LptC [Candidatus Acidoferrales bacterium]|nr:LPS export ABC transporter periplasmic protein LptC [Candidatus Acidoferrales bacterium]